MITPAGASESLEVGLVGYEGLFGITLLLDIKTSPLLGLVQGSGAAWRMPAGRFRRAANEIVAFRRVLHRYLRLNDFEIHKCVRQKNFSFPPTLYGYPLPCQGLGEYDECG